MIREPNALSPEFLAVQPGIFAGESGGDYNALFGYSNRPGQPFAGVQLTDMTVAEAAQFSDPSGPYAQWVRDQIGYTATPMGAYQVVGTTLRDAMQGMGLTGNERMTPEMQDQIGQWIYQNQGTGAWEGYQAGATPQTQGQPQSQPQGQQMGYPMGQQQPQFDPRQIAAMQQARKQQAVNDLMQTLQRPIYDFQLTGSR